MVAGFAMDVHALCDAEFPQKPLKKATYMQYMQKCSISNRNVIKKFTILSLPSY